MSCQIHSSIAWLPSQMQISMSSRSRSGQFVLIKIIQNLNFIYHYFEWLIIETNSNVKLWASHCSTKFSSFLSKSLNFNSTSFLCRKDKENDVQSESSLRRAKWGGVECWWWVKGWEITILQNAVYSDRLFVRHASWIESWDLTKRMHKSCKSSILSFFAHLWCDEYKERAKRMWKWCRISW